MSSVQSQIAQRLTKNFQVVSASAYLLTATNVETAVLAGTATATALGNSYILSKATALAANDFPTASATTLTTGDTLLDLGKEVRFGTQDASDLVVYRLVLLPGTAANNGLSGDPANKFYVCVQNNTTLTGNNLFVGVARV